ncbi:MAG: 5-(carboxyamino)imidazole ribonucleotide mutase [Calditrichaeota bacterium]|nr:5-(carboxyamino)imidazole ribonucleotide mutase [Candidatus Cloacimonadota bacterium]MCB1046914.1 5-(carboxyamino)imidazole ribonucleotide mutase [Calditrichota bacterium]
MSARILMLIGSESDRSVFEEARPWLAEFGIDGELIVSSAHRNPRRTAELAEGARAAGYSAIICGAGMAAHLAGVVASHSTLPVIGVPLAGSALNGMDALLSTVQMPAGIPVATTAIGKAGVINAVLLVARMLSLGDAKMVERLDAFMARGARLA